jgi:hypothetical protein
MIPARYKKKMIATPNGAEVSGFIPGLAGGVLLEHRLRDQLAKQVNGVTEATLGYGRADVLTAETVFEVEPMKAWRHGVRQTLGYSAMTGCKPAIALFGKATPDQVLRIYMKLRDGRPAIELWWWNGRWNRITNRKQCRAQWSEERWHEALGGNPTE